MTTRSALRESIAALTHESFSSEIPLAKTSYKESEANRIKLNALISYHELMYVDEILSSLNAAKTNINTEDIRVILRGLYADNAMYRTSFNRTLSLKIHANIGSKTTIGRNQAIDLLLNTVLETL